MRHLKALVLALAMAVAGVALIGAGSAVATELCSAQEETCKEANVYPAGTAIKASSTNVVFASSVGNVACETATTAGETQSEAGNPLPASIGEASFKGCLLSKTTSCTVEAHELPYGSLIDRTGADTATMTFYDGEKKAYATIKCGILVNCAAAIGKMALDVKGGKSATIQASEESLKKDAEHSSGICPETVSFSATYNVTSPTEAHIAQTSAAKLCKAAPEPNGTCPTGQSYTGEIKADVVSEMKFKSSGGTVSCNESKITGPFTAGGEGSIQNITFGTGLGVCNSNLLENEPGVEVALPDLPYSRSSFVFNSAGKPHFVAGSERGMIVRFGIQMPQEVLCLYSFTRSTWEVLSYNPMKMKSAWLLKSFITNPGGCPATFTGEGELTVKQIGGSNLWLTK